MLNLHLVTIPKPGPGKNEDLFGFKGDTFWILDGATSTDGPELDRDAYWLVQELDTLLNALASHPLSLAEMAAQACTMLSEQWTSASPLRPVAAIALWRVRAGRLEVAVTGNVSLLVYQGNTAQEFTDTRVLPAHAGASAPLFVALATGVQFESEEFLALRREMKHREAAALGVDALGWLAAPAERVAGDFLSFELPAISYVTVLAATDGFMELRRYLGNPSLEDFRTCVETPNLLAAAELLRVFERHPDSGRQFPRTKRHDDATAALVMHGPTGTSSR